LVLALKRRGLPLVYARFSGTPGGYALVVPEDLALPRRKERARRAREAQHQHVTGWLAALSWRGCQRCGQAAEGELSFWSVVCRDPRALSLTYEVHCPDCTLARQRREEERRAARGLW
jgi:hypothetical protein